MKRSVLAILVVLAFGFGQSGTIAASEINGEEIRAFDFGFSGAPQGDREAGPYSFSFTNTSVTDFHVILFVRIAPSHRGATDAEILAAIDKGPAVSLCPTGCFFNQLAGGAAGPPGSTTTSVGPNFQPGPAQLLPGRYAYFCPVPEENGTPHYRLGMFGTFFAK
jgi:hypothetical protein